MSHGHSHGGKACSGDHGAPSGPRPVILPPAAGVIPDDQRDVLRLCNKLMADKTFRQVEGLLGDGHRVQTFRGKMLLAVLQQKKHKLGDLSAETEEGAMAIATKLLNYGMVTAGPKNKQDGTQSFFRSRLFGQCEAIEKHDGDDEDGEDEDKDKDKDEGGSKKKGGPKYLKRNGMFVFRQVQDAKKGGGEDQLVFDPKARYFWVYSGDAWWANFKLTLLAGLVLALCMFPLWPTFVRVGVWYLAVTLLLLLVGITFIQLTVFSVVWIFGYDLWILPNLWSDEPVWELCKPLVTFQRSQGSRHQHLMRLAAVGGILAIVYWGYNAKQAGELDEFWGQQRQFVSDLYAGTLLGDGKDSGSTAAGSGGRKGPKDKWASMGALENNNTKHRSACISFSGLVTLVFFSFFLCVSLFSFCRLWSQPQAFGRWGRHPRPRGFRRNVGVARARKEGGRGRGQRRRRK